VASWSFLTNHARVLLRIARDPGARLRDIASAVGITERTAYGIVTDLTAAGYVVKQKDGRRNRYQIQAHLPLPEPASQELAIGDVLAILIGDEAEQEATPVSAASTPRTRPQLPSRRGQRRGFQNRITTPQKDRSAGTG
jgi:IclR-like helix-turn-helix domain-containing protein